VVGCLPADANPDTDFEVTIESWGTGSHVTTKLCNVAGEVSRLFACHCHSCCWIFHRFDSQRVTYPAKTWLGLAVGLSDFRSIELSDYRHTITVTSLFFFLLTISNIYMYNRAVCGHSAFADTRMTHPTCTVGSSHSTTD